jgi:hypothetical protein
MCLPCQVDGWYCTGDGFLLLAQSGLQKLEVAPMNATSSLGSAQSLGLARCSISWSEVTGVGVPGGGQAARSTEPMSNS